MIVLARNAYNLRTSTRATSKLEFKICANFVQAAALPLPLFPCKRRRFDKRRKLGRDETCNKLCHPYTHRVIMEEHFIDSDSVLSLIIKHTIASCLLNTTYYQIFVEQVAITLVTFLWTHNYLAFDHLGAFGQLLEDDDRLWQVLHHTVGHVSL